MPLSEITIRKVKDKLFWLFTIRANNVIIFFVLVHAEIAQLVEQLIRNQQVEGSSPFFSLLYKCVCHIIVTGVFFLLFYGRNGQKKSFKTINNKKCSKNERK